MKNSFSHSAFSLQATQEWNSMPVNIRQLRMSPSLAEQLWQYINCTTWIFLLLCNSTVYGSGFKADFLVVFLVKLYCYSGTFGQFQGKIHEKMSPLAQTDVECPLPLLHRTPRLKENGDSVICSLVVCNFVCLCSPFSVSL